MSTTILIECPTCGAKNRVSPDRLSAGGEAVCGRCRSHLPASGADASIVTASEATFGELVERSPVPVLLDLWAPWCGPCRMLTPTLEQLAAELAGRVRIVKVNIDENPRLAHRFQAMSIPLLVVLKDGREVDRFVGLQPASVIRQRLQRVIV